MSSMNLFQSPERCAGLPGRTGDVLAPQDQGNAHQSQEETQAGGNRGKTEVGKMKLR